jgi:hypothetical protein
MGDERYNTEEYVYGCQANIFFKLHSGQLPVGSVLCLSE